MRYWKLQKIIYKHEYRTFGFGYNFISYLFTGQLYIIIMRF